MEALWILAGRDDIQWIAQFNKRMMEYSDDGVRQTGAYGYRWRTHFQYDQIQTAIDILRKNPEDRRVVLAMWDGEVDLYSHKLRVEGTLDSPLSDLPCNTHAYLKIRKGRLHLTVCNRSNDVIWGAYGANVVHMSMLQEYIAAMVGVKVGKYHQISDSYHAYTEITDKMEWPPEIYVDFDPYLWLRDPVQPFPMVLHQESWNYDLDQFFKQTTLEYVNPFFFDVAQPMLESWKYHKERNYQGATVAANFIQASDWRLACLRWLERRQKRWEEKHA
jgi:thymidylate synthase